MTTLTILSLLVGAVLGMRLKVFVLVPTIGFAVIAIAGGGLARGDGIWSIVLAIILAMVALQFGYLAGSAIRVVMAWSRAPRRRWVGTTANAPSIRNTIDA